MHYHLRSIGVIAIVLMVVSVLGEFDCIQGATKKAVPATLYKQLTPLIGKKDALAVAAPDGTVLVAINDHQELVPASILKIVTALAALHHLGPNYRYPTDFYIDSSKNLTIKGYGDPVLVSEQLKIIALHLASLINRIEDIVLDDHFFAHPIAIPGRSRSVEPYDAPNGALCVNFNTVFFDRKNGQWVSAEPQTPLLPSIIPKIEASGLNSGRITLAANRNENLRYTGALFNYFFNKAGMVTNSTVRMGRVDETRDILLWRYLSDKVLTQIIANLMAYSNNFIANQLLLTMGAHVYGPPATVEKGLRVLKTYYQTVMGVSTGALVEASGISRHNRVSAATMLKALEKFSPYYHLMRQEGRQWYKTGTLKGVHTRAGYFMTADGEYYRFVVMINTPGKRTDRVMQVLERQLR